MDGQDFDIGPTGQPGAGVPHEAHITALGRLAYLATYCPLHKQFPAQALSRIFIPAINHDCVRFFENEDGAVCAALIWARLSDAVTERMLFDQTPPGETDWNSGTNLWFLDVLAPFGHGRILAREIARNPPQEEFHFARLGKGGKLGKVVRGDPTRPRGRRVRRFTIDDAARRLV